jgi:hypothetical protein
VTPQAQKDGDSTMVGSAGFAPGLSSMDVPRKGVAEKNTQSPHMKRKLQPIN